MQVSNLWASADFAAQVQRASERLAAERVYERILARDHTVWRPEPHRDCQSARMARQPARHAGRHRPHWPIHRRGPRRGLYPRPAVGHGRI